MHQSSFSIRWISRVPMLNFAPESLAISAVIPRNAGEQSVGTVRTFLSIFLTVCSTLTCHLFYLEQYRPWNSLCLQKFLAMSNILS